jgi:phosphonopyruvate decarboxylase
MVKKKAVGKTIVQPAPLPAVGVVDEFRKCGVTHVVWLPSSETGFMYNALQEASELTLVPVCREGETIAVSAGLIMGGQKPVTMIQNTGFFESGDSIRAFCLDSDLKLPILMLIGYRGFQKDALMTDTAGLYLEPVLKSFGIPYYLIEKDSHLPLISKAFQESQKASQTVAVLITREYGQS